MSGRLNFLATIFGIKGTGKTWLTINQIIKTANKKCLVYDMFDHPDYRFLPTIPPEKIRYWKSGNYRVIGYPDKILPIIAEDTYNCNVILEDAKRYIPNTATDWLKQIVVEHRNRNVDYFFQYHNLKDCSEYVVGMVNWLIMFKTKDNLYSGVTPRKWSENFDEIKEAQEAIRAACAKAPREQWYKYKRFIEL
jgi:hypothetical protein